MQRLDPHNYLSNLMILVKTAEASHSPRPIAVFQRLTGQLLYYAALVQHNGRMYYAALVQHNDLNEGDTSHIKRGMDVIIDRAAN